MRELQRKKKKCGQEEEEEEIRWNEVLGKEFSLLQTDKKVMFFNFRSAKMKMRKKRRKHEARCGNETKFRDNIIRNSISQENRN